MQLYVKEFMLLVTVNILIVTYRVEVTTITVLIRLTRFLLLFRFEQGNP